MSHVAHALAQIDAALAAFAAHPYKAVPARDRAFIAGNAIETHNVSADGGIFDIEAARSFHAYISARTLKAHRVAWADAPGYVAPVDVVPAIVSPGPAHLHPAAAQAVRIAFNGHRNIMTPDRMGFATCDGLFAVEYSRGTGFFDRATGTTPDIFAATVVCLKTRRPVHNLSRCFTTPDSLGRYVGKLDYLARYRQRRAVLLARLDALAYTPSLIANRAAVRAEMAYLRAQYRVTLERFGCEAPVPGDDAPPAGTTPTAGDIVHGAGSRGCGLPSAEVSAARARIAAKREAHAAMRAEYGPSAPRMVPMPVQQQQGRDVGPSTRVVCYEGTETVAEQTAEVTLREFEHEHEASGFSDLDIVIVRKALREGQVAFIGDVGPQYWYAVTGDFASPADVLKAYHARAEAVPVMVPLPVQQQQGRDMRAPITGEITLPVYWAAYLINGDASGLNDGEAEQCDAHLALRLPLGADVVDVVDGSERFTWSFGLYGGEAAGGDVALYRYIVRGL